MCPLFFQTAKLLNLQSNTTFSTMNYKLNWSEAAKYGLILASVSVVINLVTSIFHLPGAVNILLSAVKLCASVYIVHYAVKRNADSWEYISYGQSFRYGMAICSLSAVVCTLFVLLTYTVILPGSMESMLNEVFSQLDSMGMANAIDYDNMLKALPAYIVLSQLVYCIICGLVVSAIIAPLARKTDSNPFGNSGSGTGEKD